MAPKENVRGVDIFTNAAVQQINRLSRVTGFHLPPVVARPAKTQARQNRSILSRQLRTRLAPQNPFITPIGGATRPRRRPRSRTFPGLRKTQTLSILRVIRCSYALTPNREGQAHTPVGQQAVNPSTPPRGKIGSIAFAGRRMREVWGAVPTGMPVPTTSGNQV
jgi:hypothetical protein